jgi:uncharacterized membrane protein
LAKSVKREAGFIPTSRLEALTDGVFAFAMTLLVVNIELPEGFDPKTNREFLAKLADLSDTFTAYIITFFVLVGFWSGRAVETGEPEMASPAYTRVTLVHLLAVTFLPFSMLAVSRYDVAGAVWIYGANMILLAATALAISRIAARDSGRDRVEDGRIELGILILSAVLSMIASLWSPDDAMYFYLLNLATPLVKRTSVMR